MITGAIVANLVALGIFKYLNFLAGNLTAVHHLPPLVWTLVPAAVIGGLIGSSLGSTRLNPSVIRRLLSAALVIAGFKMIFV